LIVHPGEFEQQNEVEIDAWRLLQEEPVLLITNMRNAVNMAATGTIPGTLNVSYSVLTYQADHTAPETWRASQLPGLSSPLAS
jgi:hypothetical protein